MKHKTPNFKQHRNGLWYALPLRQTRKDLTDDDRPRIETARRSHRSKLVAGLLLAASAIGVRIY